MALLVSWVEGESKHTMSNYAVLQDRQLWKGMAKGDKRIQVLPAWIKRNKYLSESRHFRYVSIING